MLSVHLCVTGHTSDQQSYSLDYWQHITIDSCNGDYDASSFIFSRSPVRRYKHKVLDMYPEEDHIMWYLGTCMATDFRS